MEGEHIEGEAPPTWQLREVVYPLYFPITVKYVGPTKEMREEEITQVTISRLNGKKLDDLERFKGSEMARTFLMIASTTELSISQAGELDAVDIAEITKRIEGFQKPGLGLKTGETSSET